MESYSDDLNAFTVAIDPDTSEISITLSNPLGGKAYGVWYCEAVSKYITNPRTEYELKYWDNEWIMYVTAEPAEGDLLTWTTIAPTTIKEYTKMNI